MSTRSWRVMLVEAQWQHWNWHMCYPMHAAAEVARRHLLRDVLAVSRGTAILKVKNVTGRITNWVVI